MSELLQEIWHSIRRNKLRTFLTGFSVAWGIFMLIILLGSGNGFQNGMLSNFEGMNMNTMNLWTGNTSMPYGGYQQGRRIRLKMDDVDIIKKEFSDNVTRVSSSRDTRTRINVDQVYTSVDFSGVAKDYAALGGLKLINGRFINETDIKEQRKVVVIDNVGSVTLFGKREPIGRMVNIDNVSYQVIGICKRRYGGNTPMAISPISTFLSLYATSTDLDGITLEVKGINDLQASTEFKDKLRERLAASHGFSPKDNRAISIWSAIESFMEMMMVFNGIKVFIWIIGLGTLFAGIVGVSNIMLVTVRERTFEFGIRKSMGASPASLVRLVIVESILITAFFGYVGMIAGVGVMEVVNLFLERQLAISAAAVADGENSAPVIFKNPTLDLSIMVSATITLVIAGIVAGYIPARRAARIKTIDAMRHNK